MVKLLNLTNAEYHILTYLIKRAGFVVSREELLTNVDSIKYESSFKSIDVLIGRVRNKIEEKLKKNLNIYSQLEELVINWLMSRRNSIIFSNNNIFYFLFF